MLMDTGMTMWVVMKMVKSVCEGELSEGHER